MDANVLHSRTCRDWLFLFRLHTDGEFQLHASEDVLAETLHAIRRSNPRLTGEQLLRIRLLLIDNIDELVYPYRGDEGFRGADPNDYHVHAAAIAGEANILLTANRSSDFSAHPEREPYRVEHPDRFFVQLAKNCPDALASVLHEQANYWECREPKRTLADALTAAGCPYFAEIVTDLLPRSH